MKSSFRSKFKNSKVISFLYYNFYAIVRSKILNRTRRIYKSNRNIFYQSNGVEIGGPSDIFKKNGALPIYEIVSSLDNINYSDKTFWGQIGTGNNFKYSAHKLNGKQFIADATNLSVIEDSKYEFLLSSHVLEHIANPIKALYEWKRVIKKGGYILIILPSHKHTFDRRRKLTELEHLISDYKNDTKEDDSTHFDEIIKFHEVEIDTTVSTYDEHVRRTLDNYSSRIVHHHTFDMNLLKSLLEYCSFDVIDSQFINPYNLVAIAKNV